MNVLRAAFLVAHDYRPGGAVGLAKALKISAGTFSNEVNPEQETHKLGLRRAVAMTVVSRDFRILHAFADAAGHLAIPKPDLADVSNEDLLDLFLSSAKEGGEFAAAVQEALRDKRLSAADLERLRIEANQYAASVLEIVARVEGLSRD